MDEQQATPGPEPSAQGSQPPSPPPSEAPPAAPGVKMDLGAYLKRAWDLVIADPVLLIVGYLVVGVLSGVPLVGFVLAGPLMFGYLRVVQKRLNGEPAEFGDLFQPFQTDFGKAFLTVLLLGVIGLGIGVVLLVALIVLRLIPCIGIVLAVLAMVLSFAVGATLYFVMPGAALSDASPTDAIARSVKFCFANIGPVLLLALVTMAIGSAGVLACGVGVYFTVPLALVTGVVAYNEYYLPSAGQDA